jgi:hypothetical protein
MSILAVQKQRHPQAGFAADFLDVLERLASTLRQQVQLKIITNAGGMNPRACAAQARDIMTKAGLEKRRIAIVEGDDLLARLDELIAQGHNFTNLDTGASLTSVRDRVVSANAYVGAGPIVDALALGADIVITGRVADASLTVGPIIHEFQWAWDDWRRLSAATVAGHLLECGAQATGGLWCNWQEAPDLANVGYPIAEVSESGGFVLTKPPGSGGAVNLETVGEQLLYEVGDPAAYLTPDVVADFTCVQLRQVGPDVVEVAATHGKPATDSYKVSIAYRDGFTASGTLAILGPQAPVKARHAGDMILQRLKRIGIDPERSRVEALGTGECVPGVLKEAPEPVEVVLRVAVHDSRRQVVERFTKEFAPLVTSGPPGITGYTTGRPPVREVFAYWPALIDKKVIRPRVELM